MIFNPKLERIIKAKNIWIYGAGAIGTKAAQLFSETDYQNKIVGIAVSDKEGQPANICGYNVKSIDEIDTCNEDTLFVLAVSDKYRDDIEVSLKQHGYTDFLIWDAELRSNLCYFTEYGFVDRRKKSEKVCFVLSGYKEFLWDKVFERIVKYVPSDVEVCILSSGVYNSRLNQLAADNDWSYLYSNINDLTLIQNIAMVCFENAQWIFKVDEDIFLTERCFEKLYERYTYTLEKEPYDVGFVAPLLPVNGYCYRYILEKYDLLDDYVSKFDRAKIGGHPTRELEKNPKAAQYMWGITSEIPQLDVLNKDMEKTGGYSVCGLRFSIGFILYTRDIWYDMGGFTATGSPDLGEDERNIIYWSVIKSRAMIVDHSTVVGHFSFGPQTEEMKQFYYDNPELFAIYED